jgi:hypothetical protein
MSSHDLAAFLVGRIASVDPERHGEVVVCRWSVGWFLVFASIRSQDSDMTSEHLSVSGYRSLLCWENDACVHYCGTRVIVDPRAIK